MRVLIVGCGYVGLPLGAELVRQRHEVFGTRRSAEADGELKSVGIQPLIADITKLETLTKLPTPFDWVVNCAASGGGNAEDYRQVYFQGTKNLLERFSETPLKKFVWTSSTSVYGQTDGSLAKESSVTEPEAETAKVLVKTEKLLLDAAEKKFRTVILRVAGIYGPQRGHLFRQYLKGEARLDGAGERILNMIHREDVVGAIIAALKSGRAGEIYNTVDDEPVGQFHFIRWLSATLDKPMPPAAEIAERKRGLTNKKVSNRKLKMELGFQLKFPTFRQGYTAEIQRVETSGEQ